MTINQQPNGRTLYNIIPIRLKSDESSIDTFGLIDNGSAVTIIQPQLTRALKITGQIRPLSIEWTDQTKKVINDSQTVRVQIQGREAHHATYSIMARTMEMHLPTQTITADELAAAGVTNNSLATYTQARPQILIGLDNIEVMAPTETATFGNLVISNTPLGWTIAGRISRETTDLAVSTMNTIRLTDLNNIVGQFIENEALGIDPKRPVLEPKEILLARNQLKNGLNQLPTGYEMGLLWNSENRPMNSNRRYALQRLNSFEKQMERTQGLQEAANKIIRTHVERGYASRVAPIHCGPAWYLPIFAVHTSNKTRLVYDAAAQYKGQSLNNMLLKGPDLNEPMWNILHRFRQLPIAVCADVSEMFHRIKVPEEDRKYQRFLWRYQPGGEIFDYEMDVQTFGAVCSPCIAQYVKNENARRFQHKYVEAANAIINNTYVDDWVQSCASEEEAIVLATQVKSIQREANFELHKWMSNSARLLRDFGVDQRDNNGKEMLKNPKALGMRWNIPEDTFTFDLSHLQLQQQTTMPTKRQMLGFIMSLFDPLGLVAHQAIIGRLILRETWKLDIEWDQTIPEEVRRPWMEWIAKLNSMRNLQIPRWCGISALARELHIFVDASERAIAAVAYIKGIGGERRKVSIAASKCKLAPSSQQSIPRLELQAAVLGIRLAEMIRSAATTPLIRIVFWTDAANTIWWINSAKRRYRQYVALRIAEILSFSQPSDWRWVPSTQNPADIATKPTDWDNKERSDLWLYGPQFLRQDEDQWPQTKVVEPETHLETLKVMQIRAAREDYRAVADPLRVGTWTRLVRATAYARRFLETVNRVRGKLELEEIRDAEIELWREAQREFAAEISLVKEKKQHKISPKSEVAGWNLFLDNNGILRFQGRNIHAMSLPYDAKFPIILPRNHPITRRVMEHYHQVHLHENTQTVLNEIRQKYLIRRIRSMVNKVVHQCQWCRVNRAKPTYPQMANHPKDRLAYRRRAFSSTGIDLFGPMTTTVGRRKEKRWGVLFTCLTTRAVHMEMAHSLSGESCKLCIDNFINRRGTPKVIRSDNGTNFVWVAQNYQDKHGRPLKWKFIPPAAPEQGGAWERLVRSIKRALSQMELPDNINDQQLQSFLIKAEALVNSRPLTEIPTHPSQPALTPNHFIFGNCNGDQDGQESEEGRQRNYIAAQQPRWPRST